MTEAYSGERLDGNKHGKGRLVMNNKGVREVYHGQFEKDLYHGKGELYRCNSDGTISFEAKGVFSNGKLVNGIGIGRNTNTKRIIKASYQDSVLINSKVEIYFMKKLDRYKGGYNFKTDQFHGFGEHVYQDEDTSLHIVEYRGTFSNGKYHGYGRLRFLEPVTYRVLYKYKGYFLHGKRHGQGSCERIQLVKDGEELKEIYVGNFRDDVYDGHGYRQYVVRSSGKMLRWYIGSFKLGVRHGYGMLHDHEEGFMEGTFENGSFVESN